MQGRERDAGRDIRKKERTVMNESKNQDVKGTMKNQKREKGIK
jgi:hypothetical protein